MNERVVKVGIVGVIRDGRKVARTAVAHRLLRGMLAMLKSGETWNPRPPLQAAA